MSLKSDRCEIKESEFGESGESEKLVVRKIGPIVRSQDNNWTLLLLIPILL